jgi:coenzyme F420-reducing hydrogenase beta subunit
MPIILDFGRTVQDYSAHFDQLSFPRPERCPACGACHVFVGHGFYLRQPKDQTQVYRIWLKRWFCKACHTTLSVLPSFLLRFRHYLLDVIQQVVVARFEDDASWQATVRLPG